MRLELLFAALIVVIMFALVGVAALSMGFPPTPCEAALPTWTPPPIRLCPAEMDLWECIRTVAYRRDI